MTVDFATATRRLPHVVATGFTTALLGDERTLREFVVGDHIARGLCEQGVPAVLYLVNDTYDPLNERQLRVAVEKDSRLIERYREFCGRPIAEVPDPYGCHEFYAAHYLEALLDRLYGLDIHPVVLDSYAAYRQGVYAPYVAVTLRRYDEINRMLAAHLEFTPPQLFRTQCSRCRCIDSTELEKVRDDGVAYDCARCDEKRFDEFGTLTGKLSWKLDCAARWNIYQIRIEAFAKTHLAAKGTLGVAEAVAKGFFGGHVPEIVRYGDLQLDPRLAGQLLKILPPPLLKRLLTDPLTRDLHLTPEYIEHFARRLEVRPGVSYADFIRRILPRLALEAGGLGESPPEPARIRRPSLADRDLVAYANHFSELFFGKRHEVRLPDAATLPATDSVTLRVATDLVEQAIRLRENGAARQEVKDHLRQFLGSRPAAPAIYPFLRELLRQEHGPNITTLLAVLPRDYLRTIRLLLASYPHVVDAGKDGSMRRAA